MLSFGVSSLHVVPGEAAPQEQVTEIPVPMQEEEIVHVPKNITQTRQVQETLSISLVVRVVGVGCLGEKDWCLIGMT